MLLFERASLICELLSSLGHELDLRGSAFVRIIKANTLSLLTTWLVDGGPKSFICVLPCHALKPLSQILSYFRIEFYLTFHLFHFVYLALNSILHQLGFLGKLFLNFVASSLSLSKPQNLSQARKKIVRLDAFHDYRFLSVFNFNLFVNDPVLKDSSELKITLGLLEMQFFFFNFPCKFFAFFLALLEDDERARLDLIVEEFLAKSGVSHLSNLFLLQLSCLTFLQSYQVVIF